MLLLCCTDILFSSLRPCVDAAFFSYLLPFNTAVFRNGLLRAPNLNGPPLNAAWKKGSTEDSQLQNNLSVFLISLCQEFSEKGNEDLLVPNFTNPLETEMAHKGKQIPMHFGRQPPLLGHREGN